MSKKRKRKSKTYDDGQLHPSGRTAKGTVPDTHDHADIWSAQRAPGCGEAVYLPGDGFLISDGGFSERSKTSVYADKVKEIRKGDTGKRSLPQGGTYLSEGEILSMARAIQAYRKMTGAKSEKVLMFEEARAKKHAGTDAVDGATGFHSQSDEFDLDRSRSTIHIGLTSCGPPGMALNGSKVFQQYVVHIQVTNPDGRRLCEVMMSPEQFATALFSQSDTPCTLSSYWSSTEDQVLLVERVRRPESIIKRMKKRLKHRLSEQEEALREVAQEILDQAESGKPARKTLLREFAERVNRAVEHSAANSAFTVGQAVEEVSSVIESAGTQFAALHSLDSNAFWNAAGPALAMDDGPKQIEQKGGE